MKYLITVTTFLAAAFFITTLAIASNTDDTTSVPEVIACESKGQCEMTKLEELIKLDQQAEKGNIDNSVIHENKAQQMVVH